MTSEVLESCKMFMYLFFIKQVTKLSWKMNIKLSDFNRWTQMSNSQKAIAWYKALLSNVNILWMDVITVYFHNNFIDVSF